MTTHGLVAPVARLALSALLGVVAHYLSYAVPMNIRPEPLQVIDLPGGDVVWVPDPAHTAHFIPAEQVSCPTSLLGILVVVAGVMTAFVSCETLPLAMDAAAVYVLTQALNELLTNGFKRYCGYFRPNFFGGCGWNATEHSCTRPFPQGRHSFPSGHSSSSAAAAMVLTWHLLRKLRRVCTTRADAWALIMGLGCLTPLPAVVAGWIATSRVHDNWHSPADITAGASLGSACGFLVCTLSAALTAPQAAAGPPLLPMANAADCRAEASADDFEAAGASGGNPTYTVTRTQCPTSGQI